MPGSLKTGAFATVGTAAGQIPAVPVPMSAISTPVKATIDAINATAPDPAAFQHVSAFATAAQGAKADTALQNASAFDPAGSAATALNSANDYTDTSIAGLAGTVPALLSQLTDLSARLSDDEALDTALNAQLANKVDKVTGKGLTKNELTDGLLALLNSALQTQANADWNATTNPAKILNKPVLGSAALVDTSLFQLAPKIYVRERRIVMPKFLVSMNSLLGDVAVWANLPAIYRLDELMCCSPSVSLATVAKVGLFTGPAGTGTQLFASTNVACALNAIKLFNITSTYLNATNGFPNIYLQNVVPLGSAATATFTLTITDLTA